MLSKLNSSVKNFRFQNGETYHVLVDVTGLPMWYPNIYITTEVRNNSKASASMDKRLEAVKLLLRWCDSKTPSIDLEERFRQADFLSFNELESLKSFANLKQKQIQKDREHVIVHIHRNAEKSKMTRREESVSVKDRTLYTRMTYMADYLQWLAKILLKENARHISIEDLRAISEMITTFETKRPTVRGRNQENQRLGLSLAERQELLFVIQIGCPVNPFKSLDVQVRNKLIVDLLYYLGIRDGELLNLRISDINFENNTILIARRPDDPNDPRAYQPKVKTCDRRLPLGDELMELLSDYVINVRVKIKGAKRHDYLIVTHKAGPNLGNPLSLKSVNAIFQVIREASGFLPSTLSPHVLRHTSNDRFSEMADENKYSAEKEQKTRSYMYGWKETSGTAATYTRRHIRKKANEASLKLQENLENNAAKKPDGGT